MSADASFEATLAELEQRVRALEDGEVSLEDSLKLFEEGVALARVCHERLEAAEQRVASLTRGARGPIEEPLDD